MNEGPMIVSMPNKARPQQRYDHRLRDFVHHTGDVTIATDLGVPRSTARGWLNRPPGVVVSLDLTHLSQQELLHEIVQLRRRVDKLAALLRLALALLRSSEFTLTGERLPDGRDKRRILRAVDRARACMPLRVVLRFLRVSPSRFHVDEHNRVAAGFGVSRPDAGRDVFRRGRRRASGRVRTCGSGPAGPRGGQPLGGLRGVPGRRRGRLTTGADRRAGHGSERPASGRDDRTYPNAAIPWIDELSRVWSVITVAAPLLFFAP